MTIIMMKALGYGNDDWGVITKMVIVMMMTMTLIMMMIIRVLIMMISK